MKEAVLLLLAPIFGPDHTLLASVIHRVNSICGDLLLFLVGSLVGQGTGVDISTTDRGSIAGKRVITSARQLRAIGVWDRGLERTPDLFKETFHGTQEPNAAGQHHEVIEHVERHLVPLIK